jgi:hypothetical protein
MDHRRSGNEVNRWPKPHCAGEAMIGDVRSVQEEQIVGAVSDAREGLVGIIRMELDPAFGPKQGRADRAAKIEIEAGRRAVGGPIDQSRTGDAAAADDTRGLYAINDRAGLGAGAKGERERNRSAERSRTQL